MRRIVSVAVLLACEPTRAPTQPASTAPAAAAAPVREVAVTFDDLIIGGRDRYAGPAGVSWRYRWDFTRGRKQVDWSAEPAPPSFVQGCYDAAQRGS